MRTLEERFANYIDAGQPGLWIRTHEPDEVMLTISRLTKERDDQWQLRVWNPVDGLGIQKVEKKPANPFDKQTSGEAHTGIAALRVMHEIVQTRKLAIAEADRLDKPVDESHTNSFIMVLRNGHLELYADNGMISREGLMLIQKILQDGKAYNCHLVILTFPGVPIPIELQESLWVLDHELPDAAARQELIEEVISDTEIKVKPEKMKTLVMATGGLNRSQIEGVCGMSMQQHSDLNLSTIWELKAEQLNKRGLLQLNRGKENFNSLGGLEGIKKYLKEIMVEGMPPHIRAKAVMLLGIPGTGKSAMAKALGNEVKRPTLTMDIGRLMGGIVGQTEEQTRATLAIADAMEPCLLYVDEIEKALGGGGDNDSGVTTRLKGALLTWLNDHESDVFFIATANDISKLPGEFTRNERFDAIFFMDLPKRSQKDAIWSIYRPYFGIKESDKQPKDNGWTGAEIRACCRLAALRRVTLEESAKSVVPVILTARERIRELREWAHNRAIDAETGEIYQSRERRDNVDDEDAEPTEEQRLTTNRPKRKVRTSN
jgi:ATP-dependent 26S proteasome regulatory subunit